MIPFVLEETVEWLFNSNRNDVPIAADALPTYQVYADGVGVPGAAGNASLVTTGVYRVAFTAAAADGYARGGKYAVVATWTVNAGEARKDRFQFIVT